MINPIPGDLFISNEKELVIYVGKNGTYLRFFSDKNLKYITLLSSTLEELIRNGVLTRIHKEFK